MYYPLGLYKYSGDPVDVDGFAWLRYLGAGTSVPSSDVSVCLHINKEKEYGTEPTDNGGDVLIVPEEML